MISSLSVQSAANISKSGQAVIRTWDKKTATIFGSIYKFSQRALEYIFQRSLGVFNTKEGAVTHRGGLLAYILMHKHFLHFRVRQTL